MIAAAPSSSPSASRGHHHPSCSGCHQVRALFTRVIYPHPGDWVERRNEFTADSAGSSPRSAGGRATLRVACPRRWATDGRMDPSGPIRCPQRDYVQQAVPDAEHRAVAPAQRQPELVALLRGDIAEVHDRISLNTHRVTPGELVLTPAASVIVRHAWVGMSGCTRTNARGEASRRRERAASRPTGRPAGRGVGSQERDAEPRGARGGSCRNRCAWTRQIALSDPFHITLDVSLESVQPRQLR